MKILLTAALVLLSTAARCQKIKNKAPSADDWLEKTQFYTGTGLEIIEVHDRRDGLPFFSSHPMVFNFALGGNYVFAHKDDFLSLSANPNIHLALGWFSGGGLNFMFQAPIFLLGRIGAGCTNFNQQKIGVGLGVGLNYTYYALPYQISSFYARMSINFVAPAACAELNLRLRSGAFGFRFHINLLPFNDEIQRGFDLVPVRYMNYGFGLMWYFNTLFD
ncbi:MAG: hypothetical protein RMM53_01200 [Bacteroidia bacterium]|nr:hypothetical protein [Bacteroidia bacterium]MDW8332810.1 hypothetical protein [Bacteroidia bacterium]